MRLGVFARQFLDRFSVRVAQSGPDVLVGRHDEG
jgi:hypothetical protein